MKKRKFLGYWSLLLLLSPFFYSCGGKADSKEAGAVGDSSVVIRPVVIFARTDDQPLRRYVETQGLVYPVHEITIQTKISGYLHNDMLDNGRHVRKGDTLLNLVDDEWQLELDQAMSDYRKAMANYRIELNSRKGSRFNDSLLQIETGLSQAKINLQKAQVNLNYAHLTAPFTGYLNTQNDYSPGQYIPAGTDLGKLVDLSSVRVRFKVLEDEFHRIRIGQPVELIDPADSGMAGHIISLSPTIDSKTKTGEVVASFDNPGQILLDGMTVQGRVTISTVTGKVRVPRAAILERDNRQLLFKLHGDEVEWIYVKPAAMNAEWAIINNPQLAPGDTVAVDRHFTLSHKQKVKVQMEEKPGGE